jgi:dihydrolipoamide dehydrogenase
MTDTQLLDVLIPDIGTDDKVDVVEILVSVGDTLEKDDPILTLESAKASMDVPSPAAGTVESIRAKAGDQVGVGDLVLTLSAAAAAQPDVPRPTPEPEASKPAPAVRGTESVPLLVIGGGPGGYTAAFRAADLGLSVTLVERFPTLGGVCLNVGCIPSKALLHVARVISEARFLATHGVDFGAPKIDLEALRAWKDGDVVGRLTGGLGKMAAQRGINVIRGTARFAGPRSVVIDGEDGQKTVYFDQAIVAAGSRVIEIGGMPWSDPRVMDSTAALQLSEIPDRLLVVGGGVIGLEMATVYGALGAKLTIVELSDGLIPGCDRDLVKPLQRRLVQEFGAEILLETKVSSVTATPAALVAKLEGKSGARTLEVDRALVAVGRRPNGDLIGAEHAGLAVDGRGFITVDRQMRTNLRHIFAIGDIVGQPMLAHKATHQGKVAAEVAAGHRSAFDAKVIPAVAYTDPEIAWVGLTETDALASGVAYERSSFPWAASGRSLGMGRSDGATKLLFDPETKRVLGGGIVGPNAGDLISEVVLAIEMHCDAADLGLTIHPHPTLSETVCFAAEIADGTITDLFLPKR